MIKENTALSIFLKSIYKKRFAQNYDYVIVITGKKGLGKSRGLLLNIIQYWYKRVLKRRQREPKRFVFTAKDFLHMLYISKDYDICALDESSNVLYKGDYMTALNKSINKIYDQLREQFYFTIFVLPNFFSLDKTFREDQVNYVLNVTHRVPNTCKQCKEKFSGEECFFCGSKKYKPGFILFEGYNKDRVYKANLKGTFHGIAPSFKNASVKEYKGRLLQYYSEEKKEKGKEAIKEVIKKLKDKRATNI